MIELKPNTKADIQFLTELERNNSIFDFSGTPIELWTNGKLQIITSPSILEMLLNYFTSYNVTYFIMDINLQK